MSAIIRAAEAKMAKLSDELEMYTSIDGAIIEKITLQNIGGLGLTTTLSREALPDGSRGPITVNANFSDLTGSSVHNEFIVEGDNGRAVTKYDHFGNDPSGFKRALLYTRIKLGRPDHTFAELDFYDAYDEEAI